MKNIHKINENIYITSDEEIKEGDWIYNIVQKTIFKADKSFLKLIGGTLLTNQKIILTTNQDLIKDGVQAIDDEFLEWFVKNPSCESVEVQTKITKDGVWTDLKGYVELPTIHSIKYKIIIPKEELCSCTNKCIDNTSNICKGVKTTCIQCDGTGETTTSNTYNSQRKCDLCNGRGYWNKEIIPKEEPKQETMEYDLLQHIKFCLECKNESQAIRMIEQYGFEMQEKGYSEEDMVNFALEMKNEAITGLYGEQRWDMLKRLRKIKDRWFEQFKKK